MQPGSSRSGIESPVQGRPWGPRSLNSTGLKGPAWQRDSQTPSGCSPSHPLSRQMSASWWGRSSQGELNKWCDQALPLPTPPPHKVGTRNAHDSWSNTLVEKRSEARPPCEVDSPSGVGGKRAPSLHHCLCCRLKCRVSVGQVPGTGPKQLGWRGCRRLLKEQHRAQGALRGSTDAAFLKLGPGTGV